MQAKLTKRNIDAMDPVTKDTVLWDTDLPGFGLRVAPSGRKTYLIQYRMGGRSTPSRRYKLGVHGPLTVDMARKKAKELLGKVANGQDPAEEKQKSNESLTFNTFAERYLKEYAEPHKKPRSVTEDRRNLKNLITPVIGTRRLDNVTRSEIAKLHHDLRPTPIAANRVLALLTTMFNLAEEWGLRPDGTSPCRHIKKYKEHKRERFLSEQELARLGSTLTKKEGTVPPSVIGAIRLLIFTGARLNEILTLQWVYVDLEQGTARLADSKTGAKTIHLNPPARAVIEGLPHTKDNPYVLPGVRPGSHLANIHHTWFEIRDAAKLENVRLHDLRHAFASFGVSSGLGLPIIGGLLGHTQTATTARYAHLSNDPLKQAAELIGQKISAAMTGTPNAPVVDIHAKKKG